MIFVSYFFQGFMQGLAMLFQSVLEMAGAPIIVSWVFEKTGPKHIWEFISLSLAFCFFLWFIFYKRMIPNSERLAKRAENEKKHLQKNPCPCPDPAVISSSV
jgi:Na+-driven multidrug efflux pump